MKRTNFHLTENQLVRLKAISKETGLSVAEIIRRLIDDYLNKESDDKKRGKSR